MVGRKKDLTDLSKYFERKNIPYHYTGYGGEQLVVTLKDGLNKKFIQKKATLDGFVKVIFEE